MFQNILHKYFSNLGNVTPSFVRYTSGIISACSFSTHEIARHVSKETNQDFNTSDKSLTYLLSNENFQIDDRYWRQHINMIFDMLLEQELVSQDKPLYIQVDFTSNKDYFLILAASVIINNRSVPIYFTMRNYPRKKGQYNHKKMESAFIKGLKHALSKKYKYVIVADRGFANERFLSILENNGFDYIVRGEPNFNVKDGCKKGIAKNVCHESKIYDIEIENWKKKVVAYRCINEQGDWFLLSNIRGLSQEEMQKAYEERFKIEKCFQDLKSSGFNIEKSKIRKYTRYKKLLAMTMVAHTLLVLLGHVIVVKMPAFLKNSHLMADAILAYFLLDENLSSYLKKEL